MPELAARLDGTEFERLVRDALANLYDQVALATHPLTGWLQRQPGEPADRAHQLRTALLSAIEKLHPTDREPRPGSPEWRPYLLLRGRYVDGVSLQDLQTLLGLSERQLRREQARAVEAIAAELWDMLFPGQVAPWQQDAGPQQAQEAGDNGEYPVTPISLDITELLEGVVATVERRAVSDGATLKLRSAGPGPHALADRVVLRQVLLSLLSHALDMRSHGSVAIEVAKTAAHVVIEVRFSAARPPLTAAGDALPGEGEKSLDRARFWAHKIGAALQVGQAPEAPAIRRLVLTLPSAEQPVLLVVDDQETAIRMFQRYLGHTNLRVVGVRDGSSVRDLARRLQPRAITLDIMMPHVDGWEVLQGLQADPETRHIPVIVCSVWGEPELATSLGAADLLKKPITQKDLLAALARLHLLEM